MSYKPKCSNDLMAHIIYMRLLTNESFAFSLDFTSTIPPNAVISRTLRSIKPNI